MEAWSMQFFLVAILAMAVNAWESGDNGVVLYDQNCDFNHATFPTISIRDSSAELCGRVCINSATAKYFVARDNKCWLKGGPGGSDGSAFRAGATCGFVIARVQ